MDEMLEEERLEALMEEAERCTLGFPKPGEDIPRQISLLRRLGEIEKEFRAAKERQMDALGRMLADIDAADASNPSEKMARMLRAFEFAAKLKRIASDVVPIPEMEKELVGRMYDIALELDKVAPNGRLALAKLLDHPHPSVRTWAASYLKSRIPERALRVLREVEETEGATEAGMAAHWSLAMYEHGGPNV
jgi:hypothetical protein